MANAPFVLDVLLNHTCRYCPFCKKAKQALQQDLGNNFTVVEVSVFAYSALFCLVTIVRSSLFERLLIACLVVQLDERQDGEAIQDYLNQITGGRSVPRVFIGGKFIGGGDDTVAKQQSGELKKLLQQAGAL